MDKELREKVKQAIIRAEKEAKRYYYSKSINGHAYAYGHLKGWLFTEFNIKEEEVTNG